jgi:LuxR family quorum sensing-dependent transcriptional regulator
VLGAGLLPPRWGDWRTDERTVHLSKSAPKGWWDEYVELRRKDYDPHVAMAHLGFAPYTWAEVLRMLDPIGVDRWPNELALRYGMRDGLTCPIGGKWVVVYWSPKDLSGSLSEQTRALLAMAASLVAIRLQKVTHLSPDRLERGAALTHRELAVLRLLSVGKQLAAIATHLGIGEETVRSHLKKAQTKLGVRNRTHAVAQAMRRHLIP